MVVFDLRVFGLQFVIYYSFFYSLGYLLRKYDIALSLGATLAIGAAWLAMALFWRMHDVPAPLAFLAGKVPTPLLSYSYRLVSATLGAVFFLNLARIMFTTSRIRFLEYLGTISLELYIIHMAFGGISAAMLQIMPVRLESGAYCVLDFLFRTIMSVIIVAAISRVPKINKILFAK